LAINNFYLVVTAALVSFILNTILLCLIPKRAGENFYLFFVHVMSTAYFGMLFGLGVLLILEFLGNFFPSFRKDWTLIMAWRNAWRRGNIPLGILLSFVMGWWWFAIVGLIAFTASWGAAIFIIIGLMLAPIIGLANWALGWIYAFFSTIINRFFVIVPFFPREEDRRKVEEFAKNLFGKVQDKIQRRGSS